MTIKAKFFVSEKSQNYHQEGGRVIMQPVSADSDENKSWSKWTPGGIIELWVTADGAFDAFELGKSYYLTFEKEVDK